MSSPFPDQIPEAGLALDGVTALIGVWERIKWVERARKLCEGADGVGPHAGGKNLMYRFGKRDSAAIWVWKAR